MTFQKENREGFSALEINDEDSFLVRYRFTKETILELQRKVGQTVQHGSDINATAVPLMLQLLV